MITPETSASLVIKLMNKAENLNTYGPLKKTHISYINKDIDGISYHQGLDGDIYFKLCSNKKEVTIGMNRARMFEQIPKLVTLQELCSLLGEECPEVQAKKTTFALYANYECFDLETKETYGSMGYTLGGDYDETRREYTQEDDEKEIIETYKNDCIESIREFSETDLDFFDIYTIEKKTYDSTFDDNDDELENEETGDTQIICHIVANTREQAIEQGFREEDFNDAEIIYAFDEPDNSEHKP